jgi:threonine synthase
LRRDRGQVRLGVREREHAPYYAEGSKSMGYEIIEQLGWRVPQHTVVPMASGSLLTKIQKGYQEFTKLGLVQRSGISIHGAQATGCSPITVAQKAGLDFFKPVKPNTIAKSLAIGTPATASTRSA